MGRIGLDGSSGFGASVAREMLVKAVDRLDPGELVVERIKSYDPVTLESVVQQALRRELWYIELLGGVIGFAVGCVQMLILL